MATPGWMADSAAYRSSAHYGTRASAATGVLVATQTLSRSEACPAGTTQCVMPGGNWYCTALATDPFNCGSCCNQCSEGEVCCRGTCMPRHRCDIPMPPIPTAITGGCPPGQERCRQPGGCSYCINSDWDRRNCGGCGVRCGPGEVCCRGQCVSGRTDENCGSNCSRCGEGQRCCPSPTIFSTHQCVDLGTSEHCLDCYDRCLISETCCEGGCANLNFSEDNCGWCGNACPANEHCYYGECICDSPLRRCAGVCVDLVTDENNCGQCGNVCPPGYECLRDPVKPYEPTCYCGEAGVVCSATEACCAGNCVDTFVNDRHCGECGHVCGAEQTCQGGECVCPPNRAVCGGDCCQPGEICCGGTCVNPQTNAQHCGMCNRPCTGGKVCQAGQCVCPSNRPTCGSGCCQVGEVCCGGSCCPSGSCCNGVCCASGESCCGGSCCPSGRTCCNGVCCPPGRQCSNGTCCPSGLTGCSGSCVDLQSDPNHCGACGRPSRNFGYYDGNMGGLRTIDLVCANGNPACPPGFVACPATSGMICCDATRPVCTGICGFTSPGVNICLCCPANMPFVITNPNTGFLQCSN